MIDPRGRARKYLVRQLGRCKAEFERQQAADGLTLNALSRRRFAPSNATISRLFADPPQQMADLETVVGLAAALGVQLEKEGGMGGLVNEGAAAYGDDGRIVAMAEAVRRMHVEREMRTLVDRLEAMTPTERRGALKVLGLLPSENGG